jgi:hypothetical protein
MRTIISASRRTDIPGFYMRWFEHRVRTGYVDVRNPVVKDNTYRVSLHPDEVHTIVLWSKNFRPFLISDISESAPYRWYFNFSLVDCPEWERNIPSLDERLDQVKEIANRWSPLHINWRFDPIIFWDDGRKNNLDSFEPICDTMAEIGVSRCTFSFVTWYQKIKNRESAKELHGFDPPLSQKLELLASLSEYARDRGIIMESCCNDELLTVPGIVRGSCINGPLLSLLANNRCSYAHDNSQRENCGCTKSSDIGSYEMSCPHDCLYCYAKPVEAKKAAHMV